MKVPFSHHFSIKSLDFLGISEAIHLPFTSILGRKKDMIKEAVGVDLGDSVSTKLSPGGDVKDVFDFPMN